MLRKHYMTVMDEAKILIEHSAALLKRNIGGEELVPDVLNVGNIDNTDGCRLAMELADKS